MPPLLDGQVLYLLLLLRMRCVWTQAAIVFCRPLVRSPRGQHPSNCDLANFCDFLSSIQRSMCPVCGGSILLSVGQRAMGVLT
jgi:hypothetical protein